MKRKKALLSIALTGALLLSLTACSGSGSAEKESNEDGKKVELEIWHTGTNREDPGHLAVLDAIEAFREAHPEIEVVDSGQTVDNHKTRIRTAAAANELPDVFFTFGDAWSEDLATTGKMLDLTSYLTDEIKSKLKPGAIDTITYDGITYGLPDNGWYQTMFLNTEIFEANNIEIPTTYDQFMEAVDAFVAKGVNPIVMGGKQTHQMTAVYDSIMIRLVGAKTVYEGYSDYSAIDEAKRLEGAQILYDMGKAGAFADVSYTLTNPEAGSTFILGQYPIAILNAGFAGQMEAETSKVAGKVKAVSPFFEFDGSEYNNDGMGAFMGQWAVSADTEYPDEAFELMRFISETVSKEYYEQGIHQVGYTGEDWDASKQTQLYKDISEMTQNFTNMTIAGAEGRPAEIATNVSDLCTSLARCSITPEEFISQLKVLYE